MRLNWLGFIGLIALIILAIWLCVKYIPGASDKIKEVINDSTQTEQQNCITNNEQCISNLISNEGVYYEFSK